MIFDNIIIFERHTIRFFLSIKRIYIDKIWRTWKKNTLCVSHPLPFQSISSSIKFQSYSQFSHNNIVVLVANRLIYWHRKKAHRGNGSGFSIPDLTAHMRCTLSHSYSSSTFRIYPRWWKVTLYLRVRVKMYKLLRGKVHRHTYIYDNIIVNTQGLGIWYPSFRGMNATAQRWRRSWCTCVSWNLADRQKKILFPIGIKWVYINRLRAV